MSSKLFFRSLSLLAIAAAALASTPAHAQILHPTQPLPSFEVATVKPVEPRPAPPPPPPGATVNRPRMFGIGKPGAPKSDRVHVTAPAQLLILFAYNLPFGSERTRILGGPAWLGTEQFEVQAKIDDSLFAAMQKMTPDQQREQVDLMEQSLLADRFKLKVHFETREIPVYALVVARGGARLTPAKDGESTSLSSLNSELTATALPLEDFAQSSLWTPIDGRPVVDQTALKGTYDFTLNWRQEQAASDAAPETGPALSPIFAALQQQLGLKLVPSKASIEVIVIDHIERPSED
jgi:bla regulator protein BlaR1